MEKENELKLYVLHRDYYSGVVHLLEDDKRKPCYICEKVHRKLRRKGARRVAAWQRTVEKQEEKDTERPKDKGAAEDGARTMADVTYARIVYRCLGALPRPVPRGKQGTHVSTHCARVTQRRPRVHPRFRRRTSNVTFTDAGVRLIRRCVMQMAAWRNIRATVTGYCIVASWKVERSRFFWKGEVERKRERREGENSSRNLWIAIFNFVFCIMI